MASQGLAIDESDPNRDIYFATGNGPYDEIFGADNLGESVVRLRYDPNANTLNPVDWFAPFTDDSHDDNHKDQDLGAAGVLLVPNSQSVLAGGKEGIFYNVNRTQHGQTVAWEPVSARLHRLVHTSSRHRLSGRHQSGDNDRRRDRLNQASEHSSRTRPTAAAPGTSTAARRTSRTAHND